MGRSGMFALVLVAMATVFAQGQDKPVAPVDKPVAEHSTTEQVKESTEKLKDDAKAEVNKIADVLDHDPRAQKAAAGILQPIYSVAESLSFPAFHWIAFALMSAGVVNFALQLVLGKLIVLTRMGFSPKEIISDAISLVISIVGLVLTTQAAAENSTFTQSAAAVLSASALGLILGFILYRWGQAQELQAVAGRVVSDSAPSKKR
ncbi:MAG: hypothetical protein JWP89_5378 [Schlesneria sp.]|nr:hypothetical protein [Schlesneria sp.]